MSLKPNESLNQKMIAFLNGELNTQEAIELRLELEKSDGYANKLDELLYGQVHLSDQPEIEALTEETQRRIIRRGKWRSRFSNIYLNLATLAFIGLIVALYMYTNSIYSVRWFGPIPADILRVTADVIQFTKPGVVVGNSSGDRRFFTSNYKYELREQIGRSTRASGYYEESSVFNKLTVKMNWANGQHNFPFMFNYPTKPKKAETQPATVVGWSILEKLPAGTVAQLAISFDQLMTHDEYYKLIQPYNMDTLWFAVDTGIENELSTRNFLLSTSLVMGYAPDAMDYSGNNSGTFTIAANGEGDRRSAAYLNELKYLLDHERLSSVLLKNYWSDPFLKNTSLEKRYQFLKTNGVKLYGAIVTGPTKELLKLKQESHLNSPYVGLIDWWNWDQQNGQYTEFSR